MTFDPLGVRLVAGTGPLDAACSGPTPTPVGGLATDDMGGGLGLDGMSHHCHTAFSGAVLGLQFQDVPYGGGTGLRADLAMQQADGALDAATAAAKGGKGPFPRQSQERVQAFDDALTGLDAALKQVDGAMAAIEGRLGEMAADDPARAALSSKLKDLLTKRDQLAAAEGTTANARKAFVAKVDAANARFQARLGTLTAMTDSLSANKKGNQEKAAAISAYMEGYAKQGATDESKALLNDVAALLRGGSSQAAVTARLQAVTARQSQYRSEEFQALVGITTIAQLSAVPVPPSVPAPPPVKAKAPHVNLGMPPFDYLSPLSDLGAISRNAKITKRYGELGSKFDAWMAGPKQGSWLYMANNASREIGKAMDDLDMNVVTEFVAEHTVLDDGDVDKLKASLAVGNRQIYNTVVPVFETFLTAEINGQDGVEAVLQSDHYNTYLLKQPGKPQWAETGR